MGHKKPPTEIITVNSTAEGISNDTYKKIDPKLSI